jgi:hypothetical protein
MSGNAPGRDPLAILLATAGAQPRMPANSRYHTVPVAMFRRADGSEIPFLRRRIIPLPAGGEQPGLRVREGERLDLIAARSLSDPERWWAVADENPCRDPDTLTATPGRVLRLPGGG